MDTTLVMVTYLAVAFGTQSYIYNHMKMEGEWEDFEKVISVVGAIAWPIFWIGKICHSLDRWISTHVRWKE